MGVLGGCLVFLTGNMEDRIILDIMDVLGRPQGCVTLVTNTDRQTNTE